jgi:hypothetical protein
VRVDSLTLFALFALFALPGACDATFGPPSWPVTLQPLCQGLPLCCEPKARVATFMVNLILKENGRLRKEDLHMKDLIPNNSNINVWRKHIG